MFSTFDIFKIGLGPSSSHTTGPMRIVKRAILDADNACALQLTSLVTIELQGSLALTGKGHSSDKAALWGLMGYDPETLLPEVANAALSALYAQKRVALLNGKIISFDPDTHLIWNPEKIPSLHPNGMVVRFYDDAHNKIYERIYYSTGGGFIASEEQLSKPLADDLVKKGGRAPYPFHSGQELLLLCKQHNLLPSQIVFQNERAHLSDDEIDQKLGGIWEAMRAAIDNGLSTHGILSGGLDVARRAPVLYGRLTGNNPPQDAEQLFDWLNLYAMAVNEENAAGHRVVTAPTNGASGLIPALLRYYVVDRGLEQSVRHDTPIGVFLLTAAAIGMLYKQRASLSGAEMGCQGEVGVACSMGAAGLCAIWGGNAEQIEHAAEIGMEHNLGLTCDPVGGLVQIPCIERNAIGAVKAANAARMALQSEGGHKVSLDQVIETMRQTGLDMSNKYKETSLGGLAVNVIAC